VAEVAELVAEGDEKASVGRGSWPLGAAVAAGSAQDELKFPTKPRPPQKAGGVGRDLLWPPSGEVGCGTGSSA
jgi:hypothetical protein